MKCANFLNPKMHQNAFGGRPPPLAEFRGAREKRETERKGDSKKWEGIEEERKERARNLG